LSGEGLLTGSTLTNMESIYNVLNKLNIIDNFVFDPFLCRGMDYYTGIIFEAMYNDKNIMSSTIAAGGRYDKMIGKFTNTGDIPAIGLSLGVERIAYIMENTNSVDIKDIPKVYVASIGKDLISERIKLCCELRRLGLNVIMSHLSDPKMRPQFEEVFEGKIQFMVVIGKDEIDKDMLTIKDIFKNEQKKYPRAEGISFLLNK
jgi:histidyl-tRNA synthetase